MHSHSTVICRQHQDLQLLIDSLTARLTELHAEGDVRSQTAQHYAALQNGGLQIDLQQPDRTRMPSNHNTTSATSRLVLPWHLACMHSLAELAISPAGLTNVGSVHVGAAIVSTSPLFDSALLAPLKQALQPWRAASNAARASKVCGFGHLCRVYTVV